MILRFCVLRKNTYSHDLKGELSARKKTRTTYNQDELRERLIKELNTPKLSRIVLKQRRFESARGSKTSDSPEVRLAELDLPEVRSRINAQGGEKFDESTRLEVRLAELDLPEVRSRINAQGGEKFDESSRFESIRIPKS